MSTETTPSDADEGKLNPHLTTAFNQKRYKLKSAKILLESHGPTQKTNPFFETVRLAVIDSRQNNDGVSGE